MYSSRPFPNFRFLILFQIPRTNQPHPTHTGPCNTTDYNNNKNNSNSDKKLQRNCILIKLIPSNQIPTLNHSQTLKYIQKNEKRKMCRPPSFTRYLLPRKHIFKLNLPMFFTHMCLHIHALSHFRFTSTNRPLVRSVLNFHLDCRWISV